jgi:beta-aspartyl-peptidase (threonine type)
MQGQSDEKAVRNVLDHQVEAWNRGDLEGFMAGYSKSSDLTFFSGQTSVSGWQTMLDRYQGRYKADGREMGRLEFTDLRVDMLGGGNALVRGRWHLKMKAEQPGGLFTLIMRKTNGEWRIIHDHTS